MSSDEKSASQFISALVKNLQAVCHGHVEFDKNVKVVGHLYLTVDSNSEFNYIVNEKVSKSGESSTTFISKSFYATDPHQKTPKKNIDRPLPPPTPNVLGKTRYDISVDLTDDHIQGTMGGGRYPQMPQRNQFSRPQGYPGSHPIHRTPPRRRPLDQSRLSPQQLAKMPRLSSPQRHPMNFPSTSPRRISPSQRIPIPSSITSSISSGLQTVTSIPPESVSATPAQSLPGADQPDTDSSVSSDKPDIKFEIIKVENGSVVASSNKSSTDGEDGELRIESVASHDLSQVPETSPEKDSETKNSETSESDKPSSDPPPETDPSETDPSETVTSELVTSDHVTSELVISEHVTSEHVTSETAEAESESNEENIEAQNNTLSASNDPEVIEIDLTKVKDEIESLFDSNSSCIYDASGNRIQHRQSSGSFASAQGGDNSMSSFGGESNDDDFFASLREQTVGLYPVGLHANESNNPGFSDIPNLPGAHSQGAYMPVAGTSASSSQNNQQDDTRPSCPVCGRQFSYARSVTRHIRSDHLNQCFSCHFCDKFFKQKYRLRKHIARYHLDSI